MKTNVMTRRQHLRAAVVVTITIAGAAAFLVPMPVLAAANNNIPGGGPETPAGVSRVPQEATIGQLTGHLVPGKDRSHVQGLAPMFRERLVALYAAMPSDLRAEVRIMSGYRSVQRQRELFAGALRKYGSATAARRWVAPPGHSRHNMGMAVDFSYRTKRANEWVHANVGQFRLHFPMSYENWHVEPVESRR